jgi:hypothetical protein
MVDDAAQVVDLEGDVPESMARHRETPGVDL